MRNRAKGIIRGAFLLSLGVLVVRPGHLGAFEKKLRVASDYAHVYLQPDSSSTIIDTLERDHILSLLYSGKMKKTWYYVCFKSEKTGSTKSGYVLDSTVELLFDPLKTITIAEESENLRISYAPRNFEEMHWGLSKKQVVELEGKPSDQRKVRGLEVMRYQQRVINLDCAIDYFFATNKLSLTRFSFAGDYLDKNAYLQDYQKVKDALVQKFGRPLEEAMKWRDTSYKDDFASWGEAVSLGHLEMSSRWLTSQTEITASLSGADDEILLTVEYAGLQLKELAKKSEE
ncbi:MAG: hypothetical protein A2V45_02430 [Candidatus Aminicenantes bacterium RBG_19FT_COMBO_58_17]|nr:MAG: hypothetical protein A2V45_02430 [Candidatus Aminicenantes bacterium RBG_19FT_COMBO_58_17]